MKQDKSFTFLLWLVAAFGVFSLIFIFGNSFYSKITAEDHLVEYLGFIFLLIAGGYLIASGFLGILEKKRKYFACSILLLIGIVFIIAAFEEISWGQRIFGFGTPEKIVQHNDQNEFNFHNIDKKFFDRLVDRLNIMFVYFATLMLLLKKPQFWGIRMPDTYIILAFALIPFYHQYNQVHFDFYHLLYPPIVALIIRSFIISNHKEFASGLLTALASIMFFWLHTNYNHLFPIHNNSANEIRETLFSLVCVYYAYTIFDDVKWDRVTFGYFYH
jgi:hypothetical protein